MAKQAKVLTQREFVKLLKAVSLTRHPIRNKTMVYFSFYSGARACEIAHVRVCDVLSGDGRVLDVVTLKSSQTKGHAAGRLFINKQLQKQLSDYLKAMPMLTQQPDRPLFFTQKVEGFTPQTVINLFARLYDDACIPGASSHSGRRTFITRLASKGVSAKVLMTLARHRHLSTTQRYIEVNDSMLEAAVELV
jgi:integrase/recombinase XerD